MAILERFDPPALIDDFGPGEDALRDAFRAEWDRRVRCWFSVSQTGDPWNLINDAPRERFFNPIGSEVDDLVAPEEPAFWTAFPKRLRDFYTNVANPPLSENEIQELADVGPPAADNWDPPGPRGWQDEYCEWAVERDGDDNITKVTFTCENPEYWETLWAISPEKVVQLYRELLGNNSITADDLIQRDENNNPIPDPETGRPRYLRANPFNRNNVVPGDGNGVIHLISGPNNLFAEIVLAGGATILRKNSNFDPITDRDVLIGCGGFGRAGRNSDPEIGFYVNDKVLSLNIDATLANPVGLYIRSLNTQGIALPDNAPAGSSVDDFWQIKRGSEDFILRAEFAAPPDLAALGITVTDLKIGGQEIRWGSQLADRIQIKLNAWGRPAGGPLPDTQPCVGLRPNRQAEITNLFIPFNGQFEAVVSPSLKIERGETHRVAFVGFGIPSSASLQVSGSGVVCNVLNQSPIPDSTAVALVADVAVDAAAEIGLRDVAVGAAGTFAPAARCKLDVVESPAPSVPAIASGQAALADEPDLPITMENVNPSLIGSRVYRSQN